MKLHEEDFFTIPLLMESYIDYDTTPVIPHLVEKILDFKAFMKPYVVDGNDRLVGRTKTSTLSVVYV